MPPVIELSHVSVRRDGEVILDDVSLTVEAGEPLAIIGPNGSGKSTLVRLMTREIYPLADGGEVRWWGRSRWGQAELRKAIAVVQPINPAQLLDDFNVQSMVVTGAIGTIGVTEYDVISSEVVDSALAHLQELGVSHLAERSYATLSAGETQRVLIARALMGNPRVLFLDEPTNGLDFAARHQLLADLTHLPGSVEGLVLVTHHFAEITEAYRRVTLMRQGKVLADGPASEVLRSELVAEAFECSREVASQELRTRVSS